MATSLKSSYTFSKVSFSAAGARFTAVTDRPDEIFLCALLKSGAVLNRSTATPDFSKLARPGTIFLFEDRCHIESALAMMSDCRSIRTSSSRRDALFFDPGQRLGVAALSHSPAGMHRAGCNAIQAFAAHCLRRRGIYFVHASAVSWGSKAAVFIGKNESGKSTLAHALVLRGARLLADDSLPLSSGKGGVSALPCGAAFSLPNLLKNKARRFVSLGYTAAPVEGFFLPPAEASAPVPVSAVFLSSIDERVSGIARAAGASAFAALYDSCAWPLFSDDIRAYDKIIAGLYEQAAPRWLTLRKSVSSGLRNVSGMAEKIISALS